MKTMGPDHRQKIYDQLESGELDFRRAVAALRRSIGLTQAQLAEKMGIAPRVLIDFERGEGNPTLESLAKIGTPFGLQVTFRRKNRSS